jgi:hypothetical protein
VCVTVTRLDYEMVWKQETGHFADAAYAECSAHAVSDARTVEQGTAY